MEEIILRDAVLQKYAGDINKVPLAAKFLPLMEREKWSPTTQANVLHQLYYESGGKPIPENLNYRPEVIVENFGKRPYFAKMTPSQKLAAAVELKKKGKEAIANAIYGGINGNINEGDGYKYRGRGFIQLTGRDNYRDIGKRIGIDLENNPDLLLTDENIAQRAALAFLKREQVARKLNFDDISQVSKAINPRESVEARMKKAKKQGIEVMTPTELWAMRPAEDLDVRNDFQSGKISIETYLERRGF